MLRKILFGLFVAFALVAGSVAVAGVAQAAAVVDCADGGC